MQILYFASVRETIGVESELHDFPPGIITVADALDWLSAHGDSGSSDSASSDVHALAFSDRSKLRFALDQKMVKMDARLQGAAELAIFPPVTGG
jgi:sulfur-carrier protein